MHFKWDSAFSKTLTSFAAILGFATNAYAAPISGNNSSQQMDKPGPFGFAFPKDMKLENPYDVYVYSELLILQAQEDGLDFVMENSPEASDVVKNGKVIGFSDSNNWGYHVGARTGMGFYFNHDAWNLDFAWTWFAAPEYKAVTGSNLCAEWNDDGNASVNGSTVLTGATGSWHPILNVLDAQLGKGYHVSRSLVFSPHFGLRFGWLGQEFNLDYTGATDSLKRTLNAQNDFWGVGVRVGLDTDWIIGCNWKFFCNAAASILSGQFNLSQNLNHPANASASSDYSHNVHMNVPTVDLAVGLDWGTYLCNHAYYLDFRAGYEFQIWWDQFNLRRRELDPNTQGTFSLNGFTFKIQLDI